MCRIDPVVQSLRVCCQACRVDLVFNLGLPNLPPKSHYLHIVSVAGGVRYILSCLTIPSALASFVSSGPELKLGQTSQTGILDQLARNRLMHSVLLICKCSPSHSTTLLFLTLTSIMHTSLYTHPIATDCIASALVVIIEVWVQAIAHRCTKHPVLINAR